MNEFNIGDIFGNLKIIDIANNNIKKVHCECIKCHMEKDVQTSELKRIKKENRNGCSCGKGNNFIDLTGQKFGKLTARKVDENKVCKSKSTYWLCDCDCGNKNFSIEAYRLKHTKMANCGCETLYLIHESRSKRNKVNLDGEHGILYASNNGREIFFDKEDYDKIKDYCWYENKQDGYVRAPNPNGKSFLLHRVIMELSQDDERRVDHIDKVRYNCVKENLRICSHHENNMNKGLDNRNTSGVSGVFWNPNNNSWQSYISYNSNKYELGCYDDKKDAIKARLIAEKKYFKEFAPQQHLYKEFNIIDDGVEPTKRTRLKKILCIENNKIYESSSEAEEKLNISAYLIRGVANGGKKSTHGLHFKYI